MEGLGSKDSDLYAKCNLVISSSFNHPPTDAAAGSST